jgi:hypothetical protein
MGKPKSKGGKGKGRGFGNRFRKAKSAGKTAKPAAKPAPEKKRRRIVQQAAVPTSPESDTDEGIDTAPETDDVEAAPALPEAPPTADDERGQKTVTRKLMCKLTEQERAAKGVEMGRTVVEIEQIETRVSEINADKRKKKGHLNQLGHVLDAGEELREIECEREPDFAAQVFLIKRIDTGEVIDRQTMGKDDLQTPLNYNGAANGNGKGEEPEADPAPDSSLRTMADEQAAGFDDDDELGPIDLDDDHVEDDESDGGEAQHLDA